MSYSLEAIERCEQILNSRRQKAIQDAEACRQELYSRCPRLKEIDFQLSQTGLKTVHIILAHDPKAKEHVLQMQKENEALYAEQARLLQAMGLPEDCMEPSYTCKKCEDTGWVKGRRCSCYETLLRQDACQELAEKSPLKLSDFDSFSLQYYEDRKTDSGPSPRQRMEAVYRYALQYAKTFSTDSESLIFIGRTGLGKTHLALAIAKSCLEKGFGVIYNSSQNIMHQLETEHFGRQKDTGFLEKLCSCDLLILDDLGTEFPTSFTSSMLYTILNTRINQGLPTIISTNLEPQELEDLYGERVVSRIFSMFRSFLFVGKDIRMQKRKEKQQ